MKAAKVRFLEEGEFPLLPSWTKFLPATWRASYTETYRPFRLEERDGELLEGILQVQREAGC